MKFFLLTIMIVSGALSGFCDNASLVCNEYADYKLTHLLTPAGPIPTANDPDGVYPYMSYCETSNRPVPKLYRYIDLENPLIRVTICPDLGGKIISIIHKKSGKETLYVPEVIRYTRILPRFYFVAGGIEISFPVSHSPTQNEPVLYRIDRTGERIYVTCGERELRFGMHWSVEYSLGVDDEFLTQRVVLHNPGKQSYPWMSWSNAALPSAPDTEFNFPKGSVLLHSSIMDTIDWEREGPKRESDIREMTGYFWKTSDVTAFGAYTPSLGSGLYHVADRDIAGGVKLWSYGAGTDSAWSVLSTANHQPYIEIQGGPISDQSIKLEMTPNETRWHVEYWIPTDKRLNIYTLKTPDVKLRPVDAVPLFQWARNDEVRLWESLQQAYNIKNSLPQAPAVDLCLWAPSGMENLDEPFIWAIATNREASLWRFYYGAWLAGRGRIDEAIDMLSASGEGIAKVLCARLLFQEDRIAEAWETMQTVAEKWLLIHPQVVVLRDQILRKSGQSAISEREYWLSQVDELPDEWVIERRIQLLIDKGELQNARKLLLSTPFQKIHQTYFRTNLWKQISDGLKIPFLPIPHEIGEDRLARFGAYREIE